MAVRSAGVLIGAFLMGCPLIGTHARTIPVAPGELVQAIARAHPGDRLKLELGTYSSIVIKEQSFSTPIIIEADKATLGPISIRNSSGITISGGVLIGDSSQFFGILIEGSSRVKVGGMRITGPKVAISVTRSHDVEVYDNDLDGLRSDGINIASSQRTLISNNYCHNFRPILARYSASGKLLEDGDHPDCIQGWSDLRWPVTADIVIRGNKADGFMQGVFFGNPGEGGYDRIIVTNNDLRLGLWNGIVIFEARDSVVKNNIVRTIPGTVTANFPFKPVTSWIKVSGANNSYCGNVVDEPRFSIGTGKCHEIR